MLLISLIDASRVCTTKPQYPRIHSRGIQNDAPGALCELCSAKNLSQILSYDTGFPMTPCWHDVRVVRTSSTKNSQDSAGNEP